MKIVDIGDEHKQSFFLCLEDWSDEIKEAGNRKELWYQKMKEKGLRVKLALDDKGVPGGMIQYIPIEHSEAEGRDLYFIQCIWVHGYEKGRGNYQKKGMGTALIEAAEEDAKSLGAKGMVARGIWLLPFWMRAGWFKKHGYRKVARDGLMLLMWKKFAEDAVPPSFIKRKKTPEKKQGVVTVTAFVNGWCPGMNMSCERAKRAAAEFGGKVKFVEYDTTDRSIVAEWGMTDALFVDDKLVPTGPPPTYEKIRKLIEKRVNKLAR
jgi:GNAT superfamily N-acetyltransferase